MVAGPESLCPKESIPIKEKKSIIKKLKLQKKRPGLYIHLHSNPWFQGMAEDLPNRFELGGDGTMENPGVRWYFDSIRK